MEIKNITGNIKVSMHESINDKFRCEYKNPKRNFNGNVTRNICILIKTVLKITNTKHVGNKVGNTLVIPL